MSFEDKWVPLQNAVVGDPKSGSDLTVEPINLIANAIIEIENKGISSTPASDTIPLMDGTASAGQETAYARGDHRHPTDTTRVSVVAFNQYKKDLASDLSDDFESIRNTFALKSEVEDLASTGYVDNAIGDIEIALENIIAKYGLGGDAQ